MDVSVVIVNYNTFELTRQCIESLFRYNRGFAFEIILIDNGSTECPAVKFQDLFPEIILVASEKNLGFAGGCNLGIEKAKGEYILLLNSDAELTENSIKKSLEFAKGSKRFGALSAKLLFPDDSVQSVAQRFPSLRYQVLELLRIHKLLPKRKAGRLLLGPFFDYNENLKVDWVWGAYFFFKREILEQLPGRKLNDEYFMYYEDMQWSFDFRKLGYNIFFFSDTSVLHKLGGSSGKKDDLMNEGKIQFLKKNYLSLHAATIKILEKCRLNLA